MPESDTATNGLKMSPLNNLLEKLGSICSKNTNDKLSHLMKDGHKTLQVIADFDFTLSNYICSDGSRAMSTHALFEGDNEKLKQTLAKYLPIEYDRNLTIEQKIPHMVQWWTESHEYIVKHGYDEESLKKLVKDAPNLKMREGFVTFFELLEKYDVPLIIFSGGIGDVIDLVIRHHVGRLPKNVHIISNWMTYDDKGNVTGFKDTIVHSFNKNSSVIKEEDKKFFHKLQSRPNVIVIGDSLGDAKMDVGLEREQTVLKIGFLNKEIEKFMQDYLDTFDILCVQDPTLTSVLAVIKAVCNHD